MLISVTSYSFFNSESKPVPITNNAGGSSYKGTTNTAILIVILEALLLRLLNYLLDENPNNTMRIAKLGTSFRTFSTTK